MWTNKHTACRVCKITNTYRLQSDLKERGSSKCIIPLLWAAVALAATGSSVQADNKGSRSFSPTYYVPAQAVEVTIQVTPDTGVQYWALEDQPPANWVVDPSSIQPSTKGYYDASKHKVKWIIDTDTASAKTFIYRVTPPANAMTDGVFQGIVSFNGTDHPIGGSNTVYADHIAPTVTSISSPSVSITRAGPVSYTVNMSESVIGFDSSDIQVNSTGTAAIVGMSMSGSGAGPYTVTLSGVTGNGTLGITVKANACTDPSGNGNTVSSASTTFTVDNTAPAVVSLNRSSPTGQLTNASSVIWRATFSEGVVGVSTSSFSLTGVSGGLNEAITSVAVVSGSSNTQWYIFVSTGTSGTGDLRLDVKTNGHGITDTAGNALGSSGFTGQVYTIDHNTSSVTNVMSSNANGSYGVGVVISVQVTFTETVLVTNTPQLTLETGTTDRVAVYTSGSGTNTLVFNYTVQAGDQSSDLDYTSTSALALNGGTIKDSASNNASLTLPAPGATGSLGANKNLVIDTGGPTVTITSPTSDPTFSTMSSTIDIGGAASDNVGVTQVAWSNDRGGSGTCTGTTNWTASGISLQSGMNVITVTARDAANSTATDTLTVTCNPCTIPTITQQPVSQNVCSGETVTFTAAGSGTMPLQYQWYKGAVSLTNDERITGATTATLQVANVVSGDVGNYKCVITNACGFAESCAAALSINTGHPADTNNDWRIVIDELTAYGAAWKNSGTSWPVPPNPIPVDYVTKCGQLWMCGENYHCVSGGACPAGCWAPDASFTVASAAADKKSATMKAIVSQVVRSTNTTTYTPGTAVQVSITITPSADTQAYAVEEIPPSGWTVSSISDEGVWDSSNGKIKWGLFFGATEQTLTYEMTPPDAETGSKSLTGVGSFDGTSITISETTELTLDSGITVPPSEQPTPLTEEPALPDPEDNAQTPPRVNNLCGAGILEMSLLSMALLTMVQIRRRPG